MKISNYSAIDEIKTKNHGDIENIEKHRDDYSKNILVSYTINQLAKMFQGYFSVTGETIIERKLCDLRVSVVSSYKNYTI